MVELKPTWISLTRPSETVKISTLAKVQAL
jgi:hypothetical protein